MTIGEKRSTQKYEPNVSPDPELKFFEMMGVQFPEIICYKGTIYIKTNAGNGNTALEIYDKLHKEGRI